MHTGNGCHTHPHKQQKRRATNIPHLTVTESRSPCALFLIIFCKSHSKLGLAYLPANIFILLAHGSFAIVKNAYILAGIRARPISFKHSTSTHSYLISLLRKRRLVLQCLLASQPEATIRTSCSLPFLYAAMPCSDCLIVSQLQGPS